MAIPNYDLDDAIKNSQIRVKSLFETYRHKHVNKFTSMQRVADDISWLVYDNQMFLEYAHKLPNKSDVVFKTKICDDFSKCFITEKEIKDIIKWFTEESIVPGKHIDIMPTKLLK